MAKLEKVKYIPRSRRDCVKLIRAARIHKMIDPRVADGCERLLKWLEREKEAGEK